MKVGDILKSEIKDTPGLKLPYKIIINEKCKYTFFQKLENAIYLENCNNFVNNFTSNKSLRQHRSFSQKKCLKMSNQPITQRYSFKKNSDNFGRASKPNIFTENLPLIDKINKENKKLKLSNSKEFDTIFNDCSKIRKKIKKLKIDTNNIKSLTFYNHKKENVFTHDSKERKNSNHIKNENIFNYIVKTKNNKKKSSKIINQKQSLQNLFEYKMHQKMKKLNNIIYKLNTPIFIYNKTEMN